MQEISRPHRRGRVSQASRIALVVIPLAGAGYVLGKRRSATPGAIRQSTVVKVPVRSAYDQWTQFEEFPSFMSGVEQVQQLDDRRLHWRGKVAGKVRDWDATITEQVPDQRIAWQATQRQAQRRHRPLRAAGQRHDPCRGRDGVRARRRRRDSSGPRSGFPSDASRETSSASAS